MTCDHQNISLIFSSSKNVFIYRGEELLEGRRREGEQLEDKHPEDPSDSAWACLGSHPSGNLAAEDRRGTAVGTHLS